MQALKEKIMRAVFFLTALSSILAVALICYFLLSNGVPAIGEIGPREFLLGEEWSQSDTPPSFGILPMILGSLSVTAGAIIIGVPIGVLSAVFRARVCPN
jgi:phosphate transport system permease protein